MYVPAGNSTVNEDPETVVCCSRLVADRFRKLAADGAIVVLATHDLDLADGLITRMAVVRNGRLLLDTPARGGTRQQYRALMEQA